MPLPELAALSPQLALAVAQRAQIAPMVLSCKAAFADSSTTNIPMVSLEGGNGAIISQASVIDHVDYEVLQPAANLGSIFKPQSDYFFGERSGIQATLEVVGTPRYPVAEYMTPLAMLREVCNNWSNRGWILNGSQSIKMSFQASVPLQSFPTLITFSYVLWQPIGTDRYIHMHARDALRQLEKCGIRPASLCGDAAAADSDAAMLNADAVSAAAACNRCHMAPCRCR